MDELQQFSSCDVSDALGRIGHFGQLTDILMASPNPATHPDVRVVGLAYTVEFVLASDTNAPKPSKHHVDSAPQGSIIVIKTPSSTPNAVWGGLMSTRAAVIGVKGAVIGGRIRDRAEQWQIGFPVFCSGFSTLGAASFARPSTIGEPIAFKHEVSGQEVIVHSGDVVVADLDGVVCFPATLIPQVVQLCKEIVAADGNCMKDIQQGRTLVDAFSEHRKKK